MEALEYRNFDILIHQRDGEHYPTRVLHSPVGETRGELSFSSLVPDVITNLRSLRDLVLDNTSESTTDIEQWNQAAQFGDLLFDALISGEVRSCFVRSMDRVRDNNQGLRIRLRIEPPELAALPWELMRDKRSNSFVSLSIYSSIVRYIEQQTTAPLLVTKPPLHILIVISSPTDQQPLNVELETRQIMEALDDLVVKGAVKITVLREANLLTIQRRLRDEKYNVLHYIGHGHFGEKSEEGFLVFENSQQRSHYVSGRKLGPLLHDEETLRLVMLNACSTSVISEARPFSGVATSLVQAGIPAVVAMQTSITDTASLQFSQTFYEWLAAGCSLDTSVAEARKAIELSAGYTVEWAIPQLFMRIGDGLLFDFRQSPPVPPLIISTETLPDVTQGVDPARTDPPPPPILAPPILAPGLLDIRPVTNEEFMRFVEATRSKTPSTWQRGKYPREKANEPVTGVNWYQAVAYAQWAGKRLPRASEFDNAAGALDRARLQWEWTADEIKPRGLGRQGTKRVLKGGTSNGMAQGATQSSAWPDEQLNYIGFRCARSA